MLTPPGIFVYFKVNYARVTPRQRSSFLVSDWLVWQLRDCVRVFFHMEVDILDSSARSKSCWLEQTSYVRRFWNDSSNYRGRHWRTLYVTWRSTSNTSLLAEASTNCFRPFPWTTSMSLKNYLHTQMLIFRVVCFRWVYEIRKHVISSCGGNETRSVRLSGNYRSIRQMKISESQIGIFWSNGARPETRIFRDFAKPLHFETL